MMLVAIPTAMLRKEVSVLLFNEFTLVYIEGLSSKFLGLLLPTIIKISKKIDVSDSSGNSTIPGTLNSQCDNLG